MCLGEVGSGKTTLVAKLQGVEEYMKGRGLEYLYFSVHDDDIDGNLQTPAVHKTNYRVLLCFCFCDCRVNSSAEYIRRLCQNVYFNLLCVCVCVCI